MIRELFNKKLIKNNIFTLCFGRNAGYFSVGEVNRTLHSNSSEIVYLKHLEDFYYTVNFTKISILNEELSVKNDIKTIIDSGTTFSMFPEEIFNFIEKKFGIA